MADQDRNSGETLSVKLILALVGLATWPLAWLPVDWVLALGAAGGRLFFHTLPQRRRVAVGNIEMIKGHGSLPADLDAPAVAQECFANLGRVVCEMFRYYHRGFKAFVGDCRFDVGREHFEAAVAEARRTGRGLVLVTGHAGNWELMSPYVTFLGGLTLNVVGRETGRPWVEALMRKVRTREGGAFISKKGGAREMLATLKKGGVLGTLIDQATIVEYKDVSLPFLGHPATFNLGPIHLARRAGASIVMVLFRREGRRHIMECRPALPPRPDLPEEEAVLADARQLNDWLGEFIQRFPDQWMWGHRRWKTWRGVRQDADSLT